MRLKLALIAFVLFCATSAMAQDGPLPSNISSAPITGSEWISLLDTNATMRTQVRRLSQTLGVREAVIRTLAIDVFGAQPGRSMEAYVAILDESATRLPQVIEAARALDPEQDPILQDLKARAVFASEAGRMSEAAALLDEFAATYDRSRQSIAGRSSE